VYGLIDQPDFSMYSYMLDAMLSAYGSDVGRYWDDANALFERAAEHGQVCALTAITS
jgi:hypothetical protein